MERPCPQCGNRQHAPGAIDCRICGGSLTDVYRSSERSVQRQGFGSNNDHASLTQFSPCLMDRNQTVYRINQNRETHIGNHVTNDIRIVGPGVYSRHARLFIRQSDVFIRAISLGVLSINKNAVVDTEEILLDQDIIRIGESYEIMFLQNTPQNAVIVDAPGNHMPQGRTEATRPVETPAATSLRTQPTETYNCDFFGTILQVEGPYSQKAEATTGKVLGDAFKIALAIWKPATIIFHRQQQPDQVRLIRVQSPHGEQRVVFMRGGYASGMIQMGDEVSFWGKWEQGCLVMERAYNHSLNTWVMISK